MTNPELIKELLETLIEHVICSDSSERPPLTNSYDVEFLMNEFDAYYAGEAFRALTTEYCRSSRYESWSLTKEGAVQGCSDCLPIGYPHPIKIYSAYVEGLEIKALFKKINEGMVSHSYRDKFRAAYSISQREEEVLAIPRSDLKLIGEEGLE